jgi:hypothetical protein
MLLNEGELDGARILKPSTVKLMATDQLDPAIKERAWLPGKGAVGLRFRLCHPQIATADPAGKPRRGWRIFLGTAWLRPFSGSIRRTG